MSMRAFIALKIPEAIQSKLADVQKKLQEADAHITWTKPEGIHLTLKFLGDLAEAQVPEIIAAMERTVRGKSAFQLQVGYAGAFPNIMFPRVVWVGVTDDDAGSLKTLQEDLEAQLAQLGFEAETGRFQPHLTLGRVRSQKNRSSLLRAVEGIANIWLGEAPVNAIYLVRSDLKPTGPAYTDLAAIQLLGTR